MNATCSRVCPAQLRSCAAAGQLDTKFYFRSPSCWLSQRCMGGSLECSPCEEEGWAGLQQIHMDNSCCARGLPTEEQRLPGVRAYHTRFFAAC
jgi:hypothetical protein